MSSRFRPVTLACPRCQAEATLDRVDAVSADHRPDLREAILAGEFQRKDCLRCGAPYRLDTDFTYLDAARGQWIVAAPVAALAEWRLRERVAREQFARAYGAAAPAVARKAGAKLAPRIVFGWPALREKLRAVAHQLDDVVLEACKAALLRQLGTLPFGPDTDLRLVDVSAKRLVLAWVRPADSGIGEMVGVPRSLYDEIAADSAGAWAAWREDYAGALFVDLNRELVPQPG
jgi:CpXC protein